VRILQIHTRYREAGGEDGVVDAEADLLRGAGHDVVRVRVENPESPIPTLGALAVAPYNPVSASRIPRTIAEARPDVAHVHNTWFALSPSVIRALDRAGIPTVMTLHNYRLTCANGLLLRDGAPCELCIDGSSWNAIRHRCYRGSAALSATVAATTELHRALGTWTRRLDGMLALTEFAAGRMTAAGFPPEMIRVKPNFVRDPGPRPLPPSASDVVLFVGRLSEEKGVNVLLDAWRLAHPAALRLRIVGDGPLRERISRNLPQGVELVGRLSPVEVASEMLSARALAFPSISFEMQPLVVLEAFAASLPTLVSAHGGPAEIAAPLGPEWQASPGDVDAWANSLAALADRRQVDHIGALARHVFEDRFAPDRGVINLESAYLWASDRRRNRQQEA